MFLRHLLIAVICFVGLINFGNSSRILAVCPRASISHQIVLRGLTLALNRRGHELVVVTSDPINDPTLKNYTEIDMRYLYQTNVKTIPDTSNWLQAFPVLAININDQTEAIFANPEFRKIYAPDSNEKFDLILLEWLYWPAFVILGKRFDAPIIGLSPMGITMNVQYTLGNPMNTAHPANWEIYPGVEPSFYQRINDWFHYWKAIYYYRNIHVAAQKKIVHKFFGNDIPDLNDLEKNISLIFANQQPEISFVKANVPKIIAINGLHMSHKINPLPEDLGKILDEAENGFIYMSLGTNMKSIMLSNKTRNEFITAFSRLPYKVLWKFENDVLPDKPSNVYIRKWLPQQDVLAHPNLKVFVYQGGLQSTEEAVNHAVPLVGIPTWADQRMQIDKMVSLGVAKKLTLSTLVSKDLEQAILTVALDRSYKEKMLHLRTISKDMSQNLLDNAIWWTEHVIRHKGAAHLHSSTADEPWYRRQDMDLIAFISSVSTVALGVILFTFYKLLLLGIRAYNTRDADRIKKCT